MRDPSSRWSARGGGFRALRGARVLVTGGAGFIGSHLVDALLGCGAKVSVLDDLSTGSLANLSRRGVVFHKGDLRSEALCRRACAGTRFVFHQAALTSIGASWANPARAHGVNAEGSATLFRAARREGVSRVVYASSCAVYGAAAAPSAEGDRCAPLSPYAESKYTAEHSASEAGRRGGPCLVGLRYFNVYGPRQCAEGSDAAAIPRFLASLRAGEALPISGDGTQTRDFVYVADVVRANLLAALTPKPPEGAALFNVGSGVPTRILDLAAQMIRRFRGSGRATCHAARVVGVRESFADLSRARAVLGYRPQVALDAGLDATAGVAVPIPAPLSRREARRAAISPS